MTYRRPTECAGLHVQIEDRAEVAREIQEKRLSRARRPPFQCLDDHLRLIAGLTPTLEAAGFEIHDPVLRYAPLIERAFDDAIVATVTRRQHFRGDEQLMRRRPTAHPLHLAH